MPTRISTVIGVASDILKNKGVYDALIDFDSPLHIDPALIQGSNIPEFKNAKQKIVQYFANILLLLKASKATNDRFWKQAHKLLSTGEGLSTGLGYSKNGTKGSGIGPIIATSILVAIQQIQEAGTTDPLIFELVSIFENNIGADRISDMVTIILSEEFCLYTQRIAGELNLSRKEFKVAKKKYLLPYNAQTNNYIAFLPEIFLNDLPVAEKWDDIPFAANHNSEVRDAINNIIGESWKEAAKVKKELLKQVFLEHPEILHELIKIYAKRAKKGYDFKNDHIGEMLWDKVGYSVTSLDPLNISSFLPITASNVLNVVLAICEKYKNLIEHNGLVEHLYDSNEKRRPERFPQLLLFAVADSYCSANNIDLSREVNGGSGALDFKFSTGLAKVNVELKYSSNPKLIEGFEKQLQAYNAAEKTNANNSIYLIIKVNNTPSVKEKIGSIEKMIRENKRLNIPTPSLLIINGIRQPSASNR